MSNRKEEPKVEREVWKPKTATVEEIKKMKKVAEERISTILTELAEYGVAIGTVYCSTTVYEGMYLDSNPSYFDTYRPTVEVKITLHLQPRP